MTVTNGYFTDPAIYGDDIFFISDNDLWKVHLGKEIARRLTNFQRPPSDPRISPDGRYIAFVNRENGAPEISIMPAHGGEINQLTHFDCYVCRAIGWTRDSKSILFSTAAEESFRSNLMVYRIRHTGGGYETMNWGPGSSMTYLHEKGVAIGRQGRDPAQWKRYRGGRIGEIWIDRDESGNFEKLFHLESNVTHPMYLHQRIYFMGDHEGHGNLYSCDLNGENIRRHTDHEGFYVRNPKTDGKRIVYQLAGDLYVFDPETDCTRKIEFEFTSPRRHRQRRQIQADTFIESFDLHPDTSRFGGIIRGRPLNMAHWEGGVIYPGKGEGKIRYRLMKWLNDGKQFVVITDEALEERIELYAISGRQKRIFNDLAIGRPVQIKISPVTDELVLTNHRRELIWIDLKTGESRVIDQSEWGPIDGFNWSPDGNWLAYGFPIHRKMSCIRLWNKKNGKISDITTPILRDFCPSFDPKGRYLYFLSVRVFNPVRDPNSFDYNFPKGIQPMLLTLRKNLPSPFEPIARPLVDDENEPKDEIQKEPFSIDLEKIANRVLAIPVQEGRYTQIAGNADQIFMIERPVTGTIGDDNGSKENILKFYNFKKQDVEKFADNVLDFQLSRNGKTIMYSTRKALRVLPSGKIPEKSDDFSPSRKNGWIDMSRIKIFVTPAQEWTQIFRETWRLLREHFFTASMAGVNWEKIYSDYMKILPKVSTRAELSDLIWELNGELGTSHCYEIGGDYNYPDPIGTGKLGANYRFDSKSKKWFFQHIVHGDSWSPKYDSPLNQPGLNIETGQYLIAINGKQLSEKYSPGKALAGCGLTRVVLTVEDRDGNTRDITVKTIKNETSARLREWINAKTEYVHEKTAGRVGYIYVQDMGPHGFAQFHRSFLTESRHEALIVDVRSNGGGHVSSLLLEKLMRKRYAYDIPRYGGWNPIAPDSITGPVVALCDEYSGSDGDIFSHAFKMLKLGTLIGRRTWGGVVGINPSHHLVDGTLTTQPEFFIWFNDVKWGVENHGAEPDISIDYRPQDYATNNDRQLDRAIKEIMKQMREQPLSEPDFGIPPTRNALPLPSRKK